MSNVAIFCAYLTFDVCKPSALFAKVLKTNAEKQQTFLGFTAFPFPVDNVISVFCYLIHRIRCCRTITRL